MNELSELEKILIDYLTNGGDLLDMLRGLSYSDFKIKSINELEVIERVLKVLKNDNWRDKEATTTFSSVLIQLGKLFEGIDSKEISEKFQKISLPLLIDIYSDRILDSEKNANDLQFLLRIFALYGSVEGVKYIVHAVKNNLWPESTMWPRIFRPCYSDYPLKEQLIKSLNTSLPIGFGSIAFLGFLNWCVLNKNMSPQLLNNQHIYEFLHSLLVNNDPRYFSGAKNAIDAIPFMNESQRDSLFDLALQHQNEQVQFDAACALANLGSDKGLSILKKAAVNVNYSQVAVSYLTELGKEDEIPSKAFDPDFETMSVMVKWLSSPMEYGRVPDRIELYDTRRIFWPPTSDERQLWLFKYSYQTPGNTQNGVGMVGSITFSGPGTDKHTPEEIYGLHCCLELQMKKDKRAPAKRSTEDGIKILKQYNPEF